jgi:type II secretory pathway component GspD/PulD (secretin)
MSAIGFSRFRVRWALFALVGVGPLLGAAPQPGGGVREKSQARAAEKVEQSRYALRYVGAGAAARILRELLAGRDIRVAVDDRTNSLLVRGPADKVTQATALLKAIDVPGEVRDLRPELRTFPLKEVEPDAALEQALRLAVGREGKFVVDRRRRVVLASGDRKTLDSVAALLSALATLRERKAEPAGDLRVSVFWLVGEGRRGAPRLPDELKEAAAELGKLGLDGLRLAGRISVALTGAAPFESSGTVSVRVPCEFCVSGSAAGQKDKAELQLSLRVTGGGRRSAHRIAGLRTRVTVPYGKPVVLGAAPADGTPSAFVVKVEREGAKAAAFEFRAAPWGTVFRWLSDKTGLPVVADSRPTGAFTFVPTPGRSYRIPEIVDILNEALAGQRWILIRRQRSFALLPADEKVDPTFLPRVTRPEGLDEHGRTELVSMMIPLRSLSAEDVAPDIKKMLGPFGEVTVLRRPNRLLVQDRAGNVRRVYQVIKDIDKPKGR